MPIKTMRQAISAALIIPPTPALPRKGGGRRARVNFCAGWYQGGSGSFLTKRTAFLRVPARD
jgi:hypothetical protein